MDAAGGQARGGPVGRVRPQPVRARAVTMAGAAVTSQVGAAVRSHAGGVEAFVGAARVIARGAHVQRAGAVAGHDVTSGVVGT